MVDIARHVVLRLQMRGDKHEITQTEATLIWEEAEPKRKFNLHADEVRYHEGLGLLLIRQGGVVPTAISVRNDDIDAIMDPCEWCGKSTYRDDYCLKCDNWNIKDEQS